LIAFIVVDKIHRLMKVEAGLPVSMKEDGGIVIGPHKGAQWVNDLMQKVEQSGPELAASFEDLAGEIEEEIVAVPGIREALLCVNVELENAEEYMTNAIK
jgi:hypothetical protein